MLTIGVHIRHRSSFLERDVYCIYLDTDSNAATGTDALSGAPLGAEYSIDIAHRKTWLLRWHGSSFDPLTPRKPIATVWLAGLGPVVQVARADLGDPQSFKFAVVTMSGDNDHAPDTGTWSYELSPFALTAGRLSVGHARAGKAIAASMSVERSDFAIPLNEGAIGCAARIGGKALHGRGTFARKRVSCSWRLATTSAVKRLGQCRGHTSGRLRSADVQRSSAVRESRHGLLASSFVSDLLLPSRGLPALAALVRLRTRAHA